MEEDSEDGSISILSLFLIFLLLAIALASLGLVKAGQFLAFKHKAELKLDTKISMQIEKVIKILEAEVPNKPNSIFDEVMLLSNIDGVRISVSDLSSKLNPNYIRPNLLSQTQLGSLLLGGKTSLALEQFRVDEGLSINISLFYKDFFKMEAFNKYLSVYSYPNINTCDEFALKEYYYEATGDKKGAETFHSKIVAKLENIEITREEELANMLGSGYPILKKLITSNAQINVNFAEDFVLNSILSFPGFKIKQASNILATILSERLARPISDLELKNILSGLKEDNPIFSYLGTRTFFWKITGSIDNKNTSYIVARALPFSKSDSKNKIFLVGSFVNED